MVTAGDGNQLVPGNNIAANSPTSSTLSGTTSTNTSNTSTNLPTSGTTTSVVRDGEQQNLGSEQLPGKPGDGTVEGCPPPHPGKHEGKPSTTWTPPFVGSTGNQNQVSCRKRFTHVIKKRNKVWMLHS